MAPARQWRTSGFGTRREAASAGAIRSKNGKHGTWRPSHPQAFVGSVREGQGFAFRRKLKIQQNYKKLQWKIKKAPTSQESQFTDHYPEHLKHLYLAEEERLKKPQGKVAQRLSEEYVDQPGNEEDLFEAQCGAPHARPQQQRIDAANSVTLPKKNRKKTSNQKAQEEYEQVQAKRAAKKEEFEKRKQAREEAQRLYKKKKMEAFKVLSKRTKKGQPNLNLQMEYLLQKIQEKR
uniref:Coiled-coil domain containing 59 n=1 Tax=Jaculus jaculus TaxID=51337 RepID=A0A8C5P003_JACJA|nr:thyroid transcription factor 1-associated protein 26 [Jaculus jaculus]